MPVRASCPNGHTLNLDDKFAGKKVRCPTCGGVIAVPALTAARPGGARPAPPAAPPPRAPQPRRAADDEDSDGDERMTQEERDELRKETKRSDAMKVLMGMVFFVAKFEHLAASLVLLPLFGFAIRMLHSSQKEAWGLIVRIVIVYLASMAIQGLIGSFFWMFSPKKSKARGMAIAGMAVEFVVLLAFLFMALAASGTLGLDLAQLNNLDLVLSVIAGICILLSIIFSLVALRGLANFYGNPLYSARSMQILVWILADLAVDAVGGGLLWLLGSALATMDPILFIPMLLVTVAGAIGLLALWLLIYIKLVILLYNVKKLVAKKL